MHPLDVDIENMLVWVSDKSLENVPKKRKELCSSIPYLVDKIITHDMPFNNDIGLIKVKESFTGVEIMARLPPKSATLLGKNQMLYSKSFFHHK